MAVCDTSALKLKMPDVMSRALRSKRDLQPRASASNDHNPPHTTSFPEKLTRIGIFLGLSHFCTAQLEQALIHDKGRRAPDLCTAVPQIDLWEDLSALPDPG
jgi:hypothetical protein